MTVCDGCLGFAVTAMGFVTMGRAGAPRNIGLLNAWGARVDSAEPSGYEADY